MTYLSDADSIRFVRYFAGEATPDDRAEIERWAKAVPGREVQLERLQRLWETCGPDAVVYDSTALWSALQQMMQTPADVDEQLPMRGSYATAIQSVRPRRVDTLTPVMEHIVQKREAIGRHSSRRGVQFKGQPLRWWGLSVAASLVIGILGIAVGRNRRVDHLFGPELRAISTYATTNGERANITLPDGTTIVLDVASRLDVPADYAAGNHTVRLSGQAMFTVIHHGGTPFTVRAGTTTAQVLGTSFVVRHYATDTNTTIAVRDGKVAVRSLVVTAARQVEIPPTGVAHMQSVDPAQFSFAVGILTLNGTTLLDAIPELDRWYNVDIRLGDSVLVTQQLAGEYVAGSIADLMDILTGTLPVRVVRTGRVLTLYPR